MQLYGVRLTEIVSGTIFDTGLVERELLKIVDAWVEKNPPKSIEPLPPTAPPVSSESPHPPTAKTAETCSESLIVVTQGTPAKLSEESKLEVVRLFNRGRGVSESELARKFGVSRPTINKVLVRAGIKSS